MQRPFLLCPALLDDAAVGPRSRFALGTLTRIKVRCGAGAMIARSDRVVPLTDEGLADEACLQVAIPVRQPRRSYGAQRRSRRFSPFSRRLCCESQTPKR